MATPIVAHGDYVIRELESVDELAAVARVAVAAWGGDTEVEGPGLLVASRDEGALLAGAFTADDELVGYSHDFPTLDPKIRHSHRVGVAPAHRRQGLALALKQYQRRVHAAAGVEVLRWTFDPLRLANARLNIGPVGAIARTYLRDYYGEMTGVNAGTPSDRVLAEWHLQHERVASTVEPDGEALRSADDYELDLDVPTLLVRVPDDFAALVVSNPRLADEWRYAGRAVFEHYFGRGYALIGVTSSGYVLGPAPDLASSTYPQTR